LFLCLCDDEKKLAFLSEHIRPIPLLERNNAFFVIFGTVSANKAEALDLGGEALVLAERLHTKKKETLGSFGSARNPPNRNERCSYTVPPTFLLFLTVSADKAEALDLGDEAIVLAATRGGVMMKKKLASLS